MALYLSQARREAVADQINSTILHRTGLPAVSHVELHTRYTSVIWSFLSEMRVKSSSIGLPPGVQLPPCNRQKSGTVAKGTSLKEELDVVPTFDLKQFLDSKP